jgi:hypothetical protein
VTDDFPHGERRGYRRGCKCADCRAANAAEYRASRERRKLLSTDLIPHGTRNGHLAYGCSCGPCRAANRAYRREYDARRR